MTFLQPFILAALPLIGLPVLIHLLFRQKYRHVPWGAMMFLVHAQRVTRGMARIRYLIIMALRMAALGTLLMAAARPLTSGFLGLGGAHHPDTTLVLLDRSPSMECQDELTGVSKRATGLQKLATLLSQIGYGTRLAILESTRQSPILVDSIDELTQGPHVGPTGTPTDVPGMILNALKYLAENDSGRSDIWLISDMRRSDWGYEDGRWNEIRSRLEQLDYVQIFLLAYPEIVGDNLAIQVKSLRRRNIDDRAELIFDLDVRSDQKPQQPRDLMIQFNLGDVRSVLAIKVTDRLNSVRGHAIAIDKSLKSGWGQIEIPADANPQDNLAFFSFAEPSPRHAIIVSDDALFTEYARSAVVSTSDPEIESTAETVSTAQKSQADWSAASLVIWNANIPTDQAAAPLKDLARQGRPILFFPTQTGDPASSTTTWCDGGWGPWLGSAGANTPIATWRGDGDLWAHSVNGVPLPLGRVVVERYRKILGGGEVLARLDGGNPLLVRKGLPTAPLYFCATLPQPTFSSLGDDGVPFYVMLQRALELGAATRGQAQQRTTGFHIGHELRYAKNVASAAKGIPLTETCLHGGVFQDSERITALNRPNQEDETRLLEGGELAKLTEDLQIRRVDDRIGNQSGLSQEVWRIFLGVMALALLAEAWLCLPETLPPWSP
jgi:Aerotolerance regulator N-terminal